MNESTVYFWWFIISIYSYYNIENLYYLKHCYYKNNINKHIYISSCVYISACAIRSIFPRIDGSRICLVDMWLSYPLVGRICATFGELAFVYQLTLITKLFAQKFNCYKIYNIMNLVMVLICMAQLFCWYGVLFQNNLMHVIEESIWMITMPTIGCSYLYFCKFINDDLIKFKFYNAFLVSICYAIYMFYANVPMYYNKYLLSNDIKYTSILEGLYDMSQCRLVSFSYLLWKDEIPWMTGYFMGATFISIKLNSF